MIGSHRLLKHCLLAWTEGTEQNTTEFSKDLLSALGGEMEGQSGLPAAVAPSSSVSCHLPKCTRHESLADTAVSFWPLRKTPEREYLSTRSQVQTEHSSPGKISTSQMPYESMIVQREKKIPPCSTLFEK